MLQPNQKIKIEDFIFGIELMVEILDPNITPERMQEIKSEYWQRRL